jgi:hypothetical protein
VLPLRKAAGFSKQMPLPPRVADGAQISLRTGGHRCVLRSDQIFVLWS